MDIIDNSFVINMDSDQIRLQEFDAMMSSYNWDYERFPAINGKKLMSQLNNPVNEPTDESTKALLAMKKRYIQGNNLSPGEIGCALSHLKLWELVADNPDINRIAIFEDDARTHLDGSTVLRLLTEFYTYLKENNISEPDILYLGKSLDNCVEYKKVWGNVYRSKHPLCLHAYIITKLGAQKLLDRAPFQEPIDVVPIKSIEQDDLNAMVFHPSLYFQDIFGSTSNLRKLKEGLNSTTECLVSQQHLSIDTIDYVSVVLVAFVAALILFTVFFWFKPHAAFRTVLVS